MNYHIKHTILLRNLSILFLFYGLVLVSGLKFFGPDPDYQAYVDFVKTLDADKFYEVTFQLITSINNFLAPDNFYITFFIYALLAISLKAYIILTYSKMPVFSVFVYLSMFFFLHEYTQIRAAVAVGFYLLAVYYLSKDNYKVYFASVIFAVLFHWSAVILLVGYLFKNTNTKISNLLLSLPFIFMILNVFTQSGNFIQGANDFLISNGLFIFGTIREWTVFNPLTNIWTIIYAIILFTYLKYKSLFSNFDVMMLKFYAFGIFAYYFFSMFYMQIMAYRLIEFFSTILILLLPSFVSKFRQKYLLILVFSISCLLIGYHMIFNVVLVAFFGGSH